MFVDKNTMTMLGQVARTSKPGKPRTCPTPVAVVIGMDPLLTLASAARCQWMPKVT